MAKKDLPERIKVQFDRIAMSFLLKYPDVELSDLSKLMQDSCAIMATYILETAEPKVH